MLLVGVAIFRSLQYTQSHSPNSKSNKCFSIRVFVKSNEELGRKKCLLNQNKKINFKHSTTIRKKKKKKSERLTRQSVYKYKISEQIVIDALLFFAFPSQLTHARLPVRQTKRHETKRNEMKENFLCLLLRLVQMVCIPLCLSYSLLRRLPQKIDFFFTFFLSFSCFTQIGSKNAYQVQFTICMQIKQNTIRFI